MSENIQSISQGTYTLGETNKLTFSAGPGIKIDEPSAGTVRIGNDETVLWEAPGGITGSTSACTASEPFKNFEKVDIWLSHKTYGPTRALTLDFNVMGTTGYFDVVRPRGTANLNIAYMLIEAGSAELKCVKSKLISYGSYDTTATAVQASINNDEDRNCLYKVVGINRISGSNA